MFTLLKKEIQTFLYSIVGYITIVVFLILLGLFLWIIPNDSNILDNGFATLEPMFIISPWVFLFLIPAITMRSFAEEKKTGTLELLMTRPLTDLNIVLSKYFAGVFLVFISLLPTLTYYYTIHQLGNPQGNIDTGGMWGSYIGLMFLASSFVAIGVFTSSLVNDQITSFIAGIFMCFICYAGFGYLSGLPILGKFDSAIQSLGISEHYNAMARGVIDSRDLLYFLGINTVFIISTKTVLESRKW